MDMTWIENACKRLAEPIAHYRTLGAAPQRKTGAVSAKSAAWRGTGDLRRPKKPPWSDSLQPVRQLESRHWCVIYSLAKSVSTLQLSFECGFPENSVFPESCYERALEKRFGLESQAGAPRVSDASKS
jgi:hypothetical protein